MMMYGESWQRQAVLGECLYALHWVRHIASAAYEWLSSLLSITYVFHLDDWNEYGFSRATPSLFTVC
jgi:hypothetical protein